MLTCAEGSQNTEVAVKLGLEREAVGTWRRCFVEQRMAGLHDEPRSGAPRSVDDTRVEAVIVKTLESCPENATHWNSRGMEGQRSVGVDSTAYLAGFGLQPHRMETFKLSTDPNFVAKVRDIVGLYVSPPEHAIVPCVDKKSQIQALDRSERTLRCVPASRHVRAVTTRGTAPNSCSPPSTSRQDGLLANATDGTVLLSSAGSSTRSKLPCRANSTSISSWITTPPISLRLSGNGSPKTELACVPDSDQFVMAQPGRALPRYPHRKENQARSLSQRRIMSHRVV